MSQIPSNTPKPRQEPKLRSTMARSTCHLQWSCLAQTTHVSDSPLPPARRLVVQLWGVHNGATESQGRVDARTSNPVTFLLLQGRLFWVVVLGCVFCFKEFTTHTITFWQLVKYCLLLTDQLHLPLLRQMIWRGSGRVKMTGIENFMGDVYNLCTLRETNIAMENGPFEDVFPIENGDNPLLY